MSARPVVVVTRRLPVAVEEAVAKDFEARLNREDRPLTAQELQDALRSADGLLPTVTDKLTADVLAAEPLRTKIIANFGVGFNNIDVQAAKARGVAVSNTPDVLTDATADIAMTLMLMAMRRTGEGERELRAGQWTGWRPTHLLGSSLKGKTLGLVGFGRIAIATARRAHHGFGMKIAYYGRREALPDVARELDAQFYPELHDLLAASDFVSLHTPGGAETANLIDAPALAAMKPGSYLVNTARGGVVDHAALAEAVRSGHLAGAGLDVYPAEPAVPGELLGLDNVVLLPHLGSATRETRIAMGERALANIVAWVEGRPLPDRIA